MPVGEDELTFTAGATGKGRRFAATLNQTTPTFLRQAYILVNGPISYRHRPARILGLRQQHLQRGLFRILHRADHAALAGLPASDLGIVGDRAPLRRARPVQLLTDGRARAPGPRRFPMASSRSCAASLGERVHLGEAMRLQHGSSETHFAAVLPDAVVFPHSTEDVVAIVKLCVARGGADHRLRRRHVGRGQRHAGARRDQPRPVAR